MSLATEPQEAGAEDPVAPRRASRMTARPLPGPQLRAAAPWGRYAARRA